ncbi:hypothetical protein [Nonomuraea sp. NPDC003709]|uniref:hypothetical protein n=1 Tax=Nonomuraea sp. NPDC003709 TaxID=3154450 RepID=UPI0033B2E53F
MTGELVEGARMTADGDAMVAQVDVVEPEVTDHLGSGRVDGGQGENKADRRSRRGGDGAVDLAGGEGEDHLFRPANDADADGGVAKDPPALPAKAHERAQCHDGVLPFGALQGVLDGHDVVAGDLPQVIVGS